MKVKKIPMRTCVVTKENLPKKELLRIVRTPEGTVEVDESGKKNGRGAYIKKDLEKYMLNNPKDLKNIIVYNKNSLIGSINKIDVNYNIAKDLNELQLILEKNIKEKTLEKRNNEIEKKVTEELIKLNYDFKYCGTYYMKEIIINIYNNKYAFEGNFEKNVFPTLAVRHNKSANTIYCDIKYATKNMLEKNSQKYLINYFNYSYYTKPKIQEIVFNVLNNIE